MHRYPYHSPVRFYRSKDDLTDETNSQNCQFFGEKNPYPLEINDYHRYLIPNYENEVDVTDLELWLIGDVEVKIPCEFGFNNGRLFRVTFISSEFVQGNFEIRKSTGEKLFYSNCVRFMDSTTGDGRKYVRVATKCYYNRVGFQFDNSEYDWFVTNLPAYDYGLYMIDAEYSTKRTGPLQGVEIKDSWIDEVSTLNFMGKGDCNVINFILFSVLNNEFYINGTRRTIKEKPEVDELMIVGKMKFAYNKDSTGKYIILNENDIFSDAFRKILSNKQKTLIFIYNNNNVIPL